MPLGLRLSPVSSVCSRSLIGVVSSPHAPQACYFMATAGGRVFSLGHAAILSGRPAGALEAPGAGRSSSSAARGPARALGLCSGPAAPGARPQPVLAPASPRARGGPEGARRLALVLRPTSAGPSGASTGSAPASHSGRRARGFVRPAPSPQRRRWALARGAWPWPGSPPQPEQPPPPQSVSQSVPSNGGRR